MGLRKEKLENFRKLLNDRREALSRDMRKATVGFIEDDQSFADSVDQAAAETDKAIAMQMTNRDREIVLQIDEALRRIDQGCFGECERCGESISEARLKAFPFATLCIDCKAELESEGHRFLGRA